MILGKTWPKTEWTTFMNPWASKTYSHVTKISNQKLCPRGERDRHAARKSKWEWSAEKLLDCPMKRGPEGFPKHGRSVAVISYSQDIHISFQRCMFWSDKSYWNRSLSHPPICLVPLFDKYCPVKEILWTRGDIRPSVRLSMPTRIGSGDCILPPSALEWNQPGCTFSFEMWLQG